MKTLTAIICVLLLSGQVFAQLKPENWKPVTITPTPHDPDFKSRLKSTDTKSFYKSKADWQHIIDTTWGPGLPFAEKLNLFDYYANYVRAHNPTFTYTKLNWDSVAASWRSKITDSTSRGGFSAILSYLACQLNDGHAFACDSILGATPLNPGTPILVGPPCDYADPGVAYFGAGLTPLPDSSLLVYMVTPNHPLGLEPGDIVLGYEGVPWRSLIRELIAAEIPIYTNASLMGACPSAAEYYLLQCAGKNWHLFDTIDIVKYSTGDTVHLSTDTLLSLNVTTPLINGSQLPVAGVPTPCCCTYSGGIFTFKAVTYGIVEGTNIGYIYVYHHEYGDVGREFNDAVAALTQADGLIIDIRFDMGGWSVLNAGIARLTSYAGPTLVSMARSSPDNLWALNQVTTIDLSIPQDGLRYDRPVAVLLGPTCVSLGDFTSRQLEYVDYVRFFGKSPRAIYGGFWPEVFLPPSFKGFYLSCPVFTEVDHRFPNEPLWGKEFPIDEDIWLTRDAVAKGEDNVVKRAIEWINNLSHAHNVSVDKIFIKPDQDTTTITISAIVENPNQHPLKVMATLSIDSNGVLDSLYLYDDGLHHDGQAEDKVWANTYVYTNNTEQKVHVSISTTDPVAGDTLCLSDAVQFTSIGPVTVDRITFVDPDTIPNSGENIYFKVILRNNGSTASAVNIRAKLTSLDALGFIPADNRLFADIAPGESSTSKGTYKIAISADCPANKEIPVKVDISSDGYIFWSDTFSILVQEPVGIEDISGPITRIYPNPTENILNFELNSADNQPLRIEIYTVTGEVIYQKDYKNITAHFVGQVDLSGFAKGIYLVKVKQDMTVTIGKVVVR